LYNELIYRGNGCILLSDREVQGPFEHNGVIYIFHPVTGRLIPISDDHYEIIYRPIGQANGGSGSQTNGVNGSQPNGGNASQPNNGNASQPHNGNLSQANGGGGSQTNNEGASQTNGGSGS
jgi:hypothetical protein